MLRRERVDLVLLDVRMPRLNGIDTVRLIREDRKTQGIPVIAVTASVFPEFREKAIASGFDDFLGKPFRVSELMQLLEKHMNAEWITDKPSAPPPAQSASEISDLRLDAEALNRFPKALRIKNLTALKALAKDLKGDGASEALGSEIERLTGSFDFKGLGVLLDALEKSV